MKQRILSIYYPVEAEGVIRRFKKQCKKKRISVSRKIMRLIESVM